MAEDTARLIREDLNHQIDHAFDINPHILLLCHYLFTDWTMEQYLCHSYDSMQRW